MYKGGNDPIIDAILNYKQTKEDKLEFQKQLDHIRQVIDKYWPISTEWDRLYNVDNDDNDNEDANANANDDDKKDKEINIKNKLIQLVNKDAKEENILKVNEDFSIVMEKVND